jgi:hypothetical protein
MTMVPSVVLMMATSAVLVGVLMDVLVEVFVFRSSAQAVAMLATRPRTHIRLNVFMDANFFKLTVKSHALISFGNGLICLF